MRSWGQQKTTFQILCTTPPHAFTTDCSHRDTIPFTQNIHLTHNQTHMHSPSSCHIGTVSCPQLSWHWCCCTSPLNPTHTHKPTHTITPTHTLTSFRNPHPRNTYLGQPTPLFPQNERKKFTFPPHDEALAALFWRGWLYFGFST